ncbi:MAG TPA: YkvA family protein [Abditibacteriaceae bacterium]|jgi:uncharacterized membrane protein YkvA (DUF1232 family)
MNWLERRKQWARGLKIEAFTIYLACRDPRLPWRTRLCAACVAAYAFSPIDLIPDFIPIFGYLDDLILVPLGVALVLRMIPAALLDEHRTQARDMAARQTARGKPANWMAAATIIMVWLLTAAWLAKHFLWK